MTALCFQVDARDWPETSTSLCSVADSSLENGALSCFAKFQQGMSDLVLQLYWTELKIGCSITLLIDIDATLDRNQCPRSHTRW